MAPEGYPNACRAVRRSPVRVPSSSATVCRVEVTVSPGSVRPARYDRTRGVRKAVRWWRPLWTPDRTARTSDRCPVLDGPALSMGAGGPDRRVTVRWQRLGLAKGEHARCPPVRPWPGEQGREVGQGRLARRMVGRSAPEVSASGRRRPVASTPSGQAVTWNGDVRPTGRSAGPPCSSAGQPLPGCPHEDLIGGDGVQAGVR
jgi:hypothetical protein